MKISKAFLLFIFLLLCGWFDYAQAVGISVAPEKINIEVNLKETQSSPTAIQVSNPGATASIFTVYLEEFPNTLKLTPRVLTLNSGERSSVEILPSIFELEKAGKPTKLTLNIVSTEVKDNSVSISAGYKLPVHLFYTEINTKKTLGIQTDKFLIGLFTLSILISATLITKSK